MGTPTIGTGELTVIIIDDDEDIRALFADLVSDDRRFSLVGSFSNASLGLAFLAGTSVQAVVLDNEMPELTGIDALPAIRHAAPAACLVLWSSGGVAAAVAKARGADLAFEKIVSTQALLDGLFECVQSKMRTNVDNRRSP